MSNREKTIETRTIHPRALAALGQEACVVMLGVARDLRSGVIPPDKFNQKNYCGTARCIAGHVAHRLGMEPFSWALDKEQNDEALFDNFCGLFANDMEEITPSLAADAIERYVYDGSDHPWS